MGGDTGVRTDPAALILRGPMGQGAGIMTEVTMYVTLDGESFTTRAAAIKHSEVMKANAAGYLAANLAEGTKYWEIKEYLVSPIGMARMRELIKWVEECEGVRIE